LGLVERLRGEVTELQAQWEALGEELEAKRRRLRLAEATVKLMQRREEEKFAQEDEGAGGGESMRAEEVSHESPAVRANVRYCMSPSLGKALDVT
jgi:hypothetical protein